MLYVFIPDTTQLDCLTIDGIDIGLGVDLHVDVASAVALHVGVVSDVETLDLQSLSLDLSINLPTFLE